MHTRRGNDARHLVHTTRSMIVARSTHTQMCYVLVVMGAGRRPTTGAALLCPPRPISAATVRSAPFAPYPSP